MTAPLTVSVTGAAGNIGYALLFRLASGSCFGPDQPIRLRLLEIPPAMGALEGVVMELMDSAFPLVHSIDISDDPNIAFEGCQRAFLVGSRPRTANMDRADLIKVNGPIFTGQGRALNDHAADDLRVIVVGNPCNTNALIAMHSAPDVPNERFTAMTRLDQNRAIGQICGKLDCQASDVSRMGIWGNHSNTMFPDYHHARVNGRPLTDLVSADWLAGEFLQTVATRGKAIINARGASSAASAASAAVDHMALWEAGTAADDWTSMAVPSRGEYGLPEDLIYSFPVTVTGGEYSIVAGLEHSETAMTKLRATADELVAERNAVAELLG